MSKYREVYLNLALSLLIIPTYLSNFVLLKVVFILYAMFLVLKIRASYLPALIVISSYLLSTYIIFLSIILLLIVNRHKFKEFKLNNILTLYLGLISILFIVIVFHFSVFGVSLITLLDQYQLVLSLSSFFYGVLVFNTYDKYTLQGVFVSFIILYILHSFSFGDEQLDSTRRIYFFIVPLFISTLSFILFRRLIKYWLISIIVASYVIYQSIIETGGSTFTLLLISIYSIALIFFYYKNNRKGLSMLTGSTGLMLFIGLMLFGVVYYSHVNYNSYRSLLMADVQSFEDLSNRFLMKFFEDRGSLWSSSIDQIINEKNWLPPFKVSNIELLSRYNTVTEFDFHSHNIFIEFFRRYGILAGSIISYLFFVLILKSRKIFRLDNINPYFIAITTTAFASVLIGGATGIYILLYSYAIFGFGILGIAYAYYYVKSNNNPK